MESELNLLFLEHRSCLLVHGDVYLFSLPLLALEVLKVPFLDFEFRGVNAVSAFFLTATGVLSGDSMMSIEVFLPTTGFIFLCATS